MKSNPRPQQPKIMQIIRKIFFAAMVASAVSAHAATEITYWLWDTNQLPAYKACAAEFQKQNPDITVKITQTAWSDYWTGISTGFVSGSAPDVFTDHLARYPEFALNDQLVDLAPLIKQDKIDTGIYVGDLFKLWSKEGKQYGLPKDWDTIAIFYNKDMMKAAGVDPATLANLDWNPKDGGSYQQLIAKLSIDTSGKDGTSAGFDPKKMKQYGLVMPGNPDAYGQSEWSHFAVSNGFKFNDGLWASKFYYDDPKLAETFKWIVDAGKKGFIIPAKDCNENNAPGLFAAGKGATILHGSWMINWYKENCKFEVGIAPLAKGPEGRKSMFNGLADSIWIGSKHKPEAWKWVKFLGSPAAQKIVASYSVVFPAVREDVDTAKEAFAKKGMEVSPFIEEGTDPKVTFLFPVTDHASDVVRIMQAAIDRIMLSGADPASTLKSANQEVNALFQ
jgi:multiple sugar transport system substrate-binding protein